MKTFELIWAAKETTYYKLKIKANSIKEARKNWDKMKWEELESKSSEEESYLDDEDVKLYATYELDKYTKSG